MCDFIFTGNKNSSYPYSYCPGTHGVQSKVCKKIVVWKTFVILASWKFCVEKNCDQGLGNVAATPSQLITYLFFLSLNYVYSCCPFLDTKCTQWMQWTMIMIMKFLMKYCPHLSCVIKIFVKVCFCTKMDLLAILVNAWTKVAATLGRDSKI